MSSKKNHDLEKNLADEKQRFGIRKFSVGVASVLLGTSLMFGAGSQVAHADTNSDGNGSGDANSTDTSASDVHNQNAQATTNNYTTQSKVKAQENKTSNDKSSTGDEKATGETKIAQEVGTSKADDQTASKDTTSATNSTEGKVASTREINKKIESLEKKVDDSSLTTHENNQVQKDQSDKVTATINKSAQDSKETTTLNLQSAQPVAKSALKESKAVTPAKQVSAILNIYDYDDVDPQTPKAQNGNDVAFTYTGKFTDGLSIKDAIQAQIDADTQKQLAYKDQGTAIVPDKDGLPTEIGVSPVVSAPFNDNDLGGYFFRDKTTTTYQQNNQTQLVDAYNKWMDYKKAHFALAGYKLADQDEQAINLDDPIEDGKTYNIYVNHQISVVNVYHWTELKRTVEFKYYYK